MVGNRFVDPTTPNTRDPNQRMGFQDVNKEVTATKGVKIKSRAAREREEALAAQAEYKKKFEARADQTIAHHNEQSKKAVESVSSFIKMCQDKTLRQNRGAIADNVEREVRQGLIQLALDLNNDENDPDNGKGSVVILSALSKIILDYRDRINELEYELKVLKNQIQSSTQPEKPSNESK